LNQNFKEFKRKKKPFLVLRVLKERTFIIIIKCIKRKKERKKKRSSKSIIFLKIIIKENSQKETNSIIWIEEKNMN